MQSNHNNKNEKSSKKDLIDNVNPPFWQNLTIKLFKKKNIRILIPIIVAVIGSPFLFMLLEKANLEVIGTPVTGDNFANIDFKMVNTGKKVAFINKIELNIIKSNVQLPHPKPKLSYVPVSARYHLMLEPENKQYTKTIIISHKVEPNEVERINLIIASKSEIYEKFYYKLKAKIFYNQNRYTETDAIEITINSPYYLIPKREFRYGIEEIIIAMNYSNDIISRINAANELGNSKFVGNDVAYSTLVQALDDEHPLVRVGIIKALVKHTNRDSAKYLLNALKDQNFAVKKAAVASLGIIKDIRAFYPLLDMLYNGEEGIRELAAQALGNLGDKRAISFLSCALNSSDWSVYPAATESLGRLEAIEVLLEATKHHDQKVREMATDLLGKLSQKENKK